MTQDLITGAGFLEPGQRNAEIVYNDAVLRMTVMSANCVDVLGPSVPSAPVAPYLMIFDATHATRPNQLAYYWADGQWFYMNPNKYQIYYNLATPGYLRFNGTAWVSV